MTSLVWSRLAEFMAMSGWAALISVVATAGSVPRGPGARLVLLPDGGFFGTIGGGALEYEAMAIAREALARGESRPMLRVWPLGPDLGQCCGGRVTTLTELFSPADAATLAEFAAREATAPFETLTRLDAGRVRRDVLAPGAPRPPASPGLFIERFGDARTRLLLFGAGHVGRALVLALAPLPFAIRWLDARAQAFPDIVPGAVHIVADPDIEAEIAAAPPGAFVMVMTHSHPLDLAICLAALRREDLLFVGLIGSATKRARFIRRMRAIGFGDAQEARLVCPVGVPGISGKEPAVIAASVAAQLLILRERRQSPDALSLRHSLVPEAAL